MTTSQEKATVHLPGQPPAATSEPEPALGPAAAALVAAGAGAAVLGVLTTIAEASTSFANWLKFSTAVGPLSGKTILAIAAWLVIWLVLHLTMRQTRLTRPILAVSAALLAAGLLGTFPVFFDLFGSG